MFKAAKYVFSRKVIHTFRLLHHKILVPHLVLGGKNIWCRLSATSVNGVITLTTNQSVGR